MEKALAEAARPTLARIARDRRRASDEVARLLDQVATRLFDAGFRGEDVTAVLGRDAEAGRDAFAAEIGVSLADYVAEAQLETGVRLLLTSRRPSAEISRLIGDHAPAVFSNAVERTFGLSPGKLRRRARPARQPRMPADGDEAESLSPAERARFIQRTKARLEALLARLPPGDRDDLRCRVVQPRLASGG